LNKIEEAINNNELGLITLQAVDYLKLRKKTSLEPALIVPMMEMHQKIILSL